MNRYMITREKIKGQEYLISALYDEKKHMIEVLPEAAGETSLLGNIYVGKVENIVTNLNAAFVKIAPDIRCYLPLSDVKNPVFTRKLSQTKALAAGDELLVQVSREALKTKDPAVTTNFRKPEEERLIKGKGGGQRASGEACRADGRGVRRDSPHQCRRGFR